MHVSHCLTRASSDLASVDLTEIIGSSRDPEELKYVWLSWRDQTGKTMRDDYKEFVQLINEAAKINGTRGVCSRGLTSSSIV